VSERDDGLSGSSSIQPISGLPAIVSQTPGPTITDELTSAKSYARDAKSEATRRAYRADWQHFSEWCSRHNAEPLPARIDAVAAYLAHLADAGLKASTITRRCAAIAYAHRAAAVAPPTAAEPVKAVLKGIRRRIGVAVERKAPATARAITAMLKHCSKPRDRAVLLLGFAAALRRSELVDLQVADLEFTAEGMIVHIRRSKTDQEGEGHQVAVPRGSKLKPVEAVEAWLAVRGTEPGPLFGISDNTVANIVKRYAKRAKLDPALFSGHSLRAGFVTSALEAGADILKVMDVTRHREVKTLKAYDRRARAFKDHAGKGFL
jgi:site-specific recombinase XerD